MPNYIHGATNYLGFMVARESLIIYDEVESTLESTMKIAYTVAYGLTLQWFGNLYDWFGKHGFLFYEGIAHILACFSIDEEFGEWDIHSEEYINNLLKIYEFDSVKHTLPVSVNVLFYFTEYCALELWILWPRIVQTF